MKSNNNMNVFSILEHSNPKIFKIYIRMTLRYIFLQLLFTPFYPYAIKRIKKIDKNYNLDKLFDFTQTFCFGLLRTLQVRYEFLELLKILKKKKPKYILEIGTAFGGTLFLFTRIASNCAKIISIDLPGGNFGGGYLKTRMKLYKEFALNNQKIYLIRKNSHKKETLEEIKNILAGNKLDFLFIDGDHTYEGIKEDFRLYSKIVKKGGIIALHDIVNSDIKGVEVSVFWDEIKSKYKTIEIIKDKNQNWAGIGLINMK
jgi:predicted O-methyltransferase YrrM